MTTSLMCRSALLASLLALGAHSFAQTPTKTRIEIADAAQPQLTTDSRGRVWLAYGHAKDVFVARSDDGGKTFAPGVKVTSQPKLMLGMRRGPRIAAHGDEVTVTIVAHELLAFHSSDGGRTWSEPTTINEVPTSAREGLHDLASALDGRLFITWLDMRNGKMELWGAESSDAGRTWGKNAQVYRSPDKSICECCHPTALFDAQGNLAVMWRNSINGARDMWMATRARGAKQFTEPQKLGEGTWTLNGCPMDGGRLVALGGGKFSSVWQRNGEIFLSPSSASAEIKLAKGKQPVALTQEGRTMLFWQQGTDLWSMREVGKSEPAKHAAEARFPVMAALPGNRGAIVAYEQGPAKGAVKVVIETL